MFSRLVSFVLGLVCVGLAAWIVYRELQPVQQLPGSVTDGLPRTEQQFRDRLSALRMDREKLMRGIERLNIRKQETVEYLRSRGVSSTADIRGKPDLEYAARNLKGWTEEIARLEADAGKFDKAISAIMTMLDEMERKRINQSVAISEEEWRRLRAIEVDLDEKLDMDSNSLLKDQELNQILQSELGGNEGEKKN